MHTFFFRKRFAYNKIKKTCIHYSIQTHKDMATKYSYKYIYLKGKKEKK